MSPDASHCPECGETQFQPTSAWTVHGPDAARLLILVVPVANLLSGHWLLAAAWAVLAAMLLPSRVRSLGQYVFMAKGERPIFVRCARCKRSIALHERASASLVTWLRPQPMGQGGMFLDTSNTVRALNVVRALCALEERVLHWAKGNLGKGVGGVLVLTTRRVLFAHDDGLGRKTTREINLAGVHSIYVQAADEPPHEAQITLAGNGQTIEVQRASSVYPDGVREFGRAVAQAVQSN